MTNAVEHPTNDEHLALVLSGGGARAAYQVGVLLANGERFPDLRIPILTGVSAGAINSAYLARYCGTFGSAVSDMREEWAKLTPDRVYCVRPVDMVRAAFRWLLNFVIGRRSEPGVVQGLMDMAPLRRLPRRLHRFRRHRRERQGRPLTRCGTDYHVLHHGPDGNVCAGQPGMSRLGTVAADRDHRIPHPRPRHGVLGDPHHLPGRQDAGWVLW